MKHVVEWNGHYLTGYLVALVIGFLMGARMLTFIAPSPWTFETSSTSTSALAASKGPRPTSGTRTASSCDMLREASLTGSEADVIASMKIIIADKTVSSTARKNARDYIERNKPNKYAQERTEIFCRFGRSASG